jgi:hypothetical protein
MKGNKMKMTDHSASMVAFAALCEEIEASNLVNADECQYWVFERGYRAAIQELIEIADSGAQAKKYASPKLQDIAERLMRTAKQG